jgi:hypothetical protein
VTMRRAFAAVALAAALALAGCAGPVAVDDDGTTTGATDGTTGATADGTTGATDGTTAAADGTTADGTTADASTTDATTTSTDATTATTTTSTTDDGSRGVGETNSRVAVRGGTLPVNATRVYERVEAVMRTNATAPASIRVTNATAFYGNASGTTTGSASGHARLERALGLAQPLTRSRLVGPNGATVGYGTVAVYPGANATPASTGALLAHEFAHYVQFRQGREAALAGNLTRPRTTDGAFVRRAILEGVAVAVGTAYVRRHHPGAETGIERSERALDALPEGSAFRYTQLAYVAGYEYVLAREDDPASATSVYADPPRTSEQVLHATRDQPVPLSVTVDASDAGYRGGVADRLGEAFLRTALANAQRDADGTGTAAADAPNASVAAAGWGEDALVVLRRNGTTSNAWALRFDTARDATDARDALAAVLDARGDRIPEDASPHWRLPDATAALHRPANRTLVLAVGTPRFVADLAVTATPGTVTLALDDANASTTRVTGTTARVTGTTARVTGTTARVTGTTARPAGVEARNSRQGPTRDRNLSRGASSIRTWHTSTSSERAT